MYLNVWPQLVELFGEVIELLGFGELVKVHHWKVGRGDFLGFTALLHICHHLRFIYADENVSNLFPVPAACFPNHEGLALWSQKQK